MVIGSGITGLTAAHRTHRDGLSVRVLERSQHPGGSVRTIKRDGFLVEAGPNTLQLNEPEQESVLKATGLLEDARSTNPQAAKRYIIRSGKPVPVPGGLFQGLRTPLLNMRSKMRLPFEPLIKRGEGSDETVADFVRRRLGQEFLDYLINPMVGGIYAGDPEVLSIRYAFPRVYALEVEFGSLIRGAVAGMNQKRRDDSAFRTRLISWDEGMATLPYRLARPLEVTYNVEIKGMENSGNGWRVSLESPREGSETISCERLILNVPAHALGALPLPAELARELEPLSEIAYPPLSVLALGFRREDVEHPLDGFGMLVPQRERFNILGALFSSTLFPGRAPEGHVLITSFLGGARQPRLAGFSRSELSSLVQSDLNRLLGLNGSAVFCEHIHWERAIPQYILGYEKYLNCIESVESSYQGLKLLGSYHGGIALGKCLVNGWNIGSE